MTEKLMLKICMISKQNGNVLFSFLISIQTIVNRNTSVSSENGDVKLNFFL